MDFASYIIFLSLVSLGGLAGWRINQLIAAKGGGDNSELTALQSQNTALEATNVGLKEQLNETKEDLAAHQEENATLNKKLGNLEERDVAFREAQKQAKIEFENLTNKMLKQTSEDFKKSSEESLKTLLNPLDTQIKDFNDKITGFTALNKKMTTETENLTKALTSNVKAQGDWGEDVLKKILEDSGLKEGRNYTVQGKGMELKSADGGRQMPDIVVNLPEQKHIVIDSKVSLKSYMDYKNAPDKETEIEATKNFTKSVEAHINDLAGKRYQDIYKLETLDFVIMFMPLEASYFLLLSQKEELIRKAWDKNISILTPSNLFPNLKTIAYLWQLQEQNANAKEIARIGGRVYEKTRLFLEDMKNVGKSLDKAKESHGEAIKKLADGKGNLMTQAEKLKSLGVSTENSLPDMSQE